MGLSSVQLDLISQTQLVTLSWPDLAQLSSLKAKLCQPQVYFLSVTQVVFDLNAHNSPLTCSEYVNKLLYLNMLMFSMQDLAC